MTARTVALLWAWAAASASLAHSNGVFDPRDFGARGDGIALDSPAINRAIDACCSAGGGRVRLGPGTYRAGTVLLKDRVTLEIARYAVLIGSKDLKDYRSVVYPQGKNEGFVVALGAHHVAVVGEGAIDGNTVFNPDGEEHMRGPHALVFYDCEDVTISGVQIRNASNWAVMLWAARGVTIAAIQIRGGWDGVNMHDVVDATISHCRFFTGDDCLAGSYWENVTVSDCVLNSSANAIRVSGRNVFFNDCLIYGPGQSSAGSSLRHRTEAGFQILPNRTHTRNKYAAVGPADNMVLSHITMMNVGTPVWIDSSSGSAYNTDNQGIGRIVFNDLRVVHAGKTPFYVAANPDRPAKEIVLNRVTMSLVGGGDPAQAAGQGFSPFSVLAASAFYWRNVERVKMTDVSVSYERRDGRVPMIAENAGPVDMERVSLGETASNPALLKRISRKKMAAAARLGPGSPLPAPFEAFQNTPALIEARGLGIFIQAGGDHPVLQQGDQYGAAYIRHGLSEHATVVVRMENPEGRTSWMGRAGIIVRNRIDLPGVSGGYLVLGSSPAAGSYLEWESDGHGRLDRHTEFDGYTIWPHWLKLRRDGPRFYGYVSADGTAWEPIGRADLPDAERSLDAGMFVFRDSALFRDFQIEP